MKSLLFAALSTLGLAAVADPLTTLNPNPSAPATSRAAIDPVKDLPRYPAVEPKDADRDMDSEARLQARARRARAAGARSHRDHASTKTAACSSAR